MKKHLSVLVIIIFIFSYGKGQSIVDKEKFAKTFISIFQQRANGFDTLKAKSWPENSEPKITLPGARESYISENHVYGAIYRGPDSLKMLDFYREMKQVLGVVAGYYGATAKFVPTNSEDLYDEQFFFADAELFTNEGSSISFFKTTRPEDEEEVEENEDGDLDITVKKKAIKDSFDVMLLIRPGGQVGYFTAAGEKLADEEVRQLITQVAFGSDLTWSSIKVNKRMDGQVAVYDSKVKLKGFGAEIREWTAGKKTDRAMILTRIYNTTEETFRRTADSLVFKIKAAMPGNYYYEIFQDEDGILVEFSPIPFQKQQTDTRRIKIIYTAVENKKDTYRLELSVGR